MLKVLVYFLLFLALNCQISLEQAAYGCRRGCNGKTGAPPPPLSVLQRPPPPPPSPPPPPPPPSPPPPPPVPRLHSKEVYAVNRLLRLLWTSSAVASVSFDSLGCHYINYRPVLTCDCTSEANTCTVTDIYLTGRDLRGYIPPQIGNLSNLRSLYLRSNKLRGTIPDSFRSLTQLSYLDLCDNMLEGPIPSFLGDLVSLRSLYLCYNGFNESIPRELGRLPLEYLYLHNNDLSGELPVELGNISSLEGLYLSDNLLNGTLPQQLGNLRNLQYMYLRNNFFNGELPPSFENLANLRGFYIRGNNISGAIPRFISKWQNLEFLTLMGNNFKGPLPTEISALANLNYLEVNDLAGGGTDVQFPDIQNLSFLEVLTLRNCSLTGSIPEFVWWFNLSYLDLSFNSLTGKIPAVVKEKFPKYIFLRSNNLRGSVPGWLTNLSESYVDISENSFTRVTLPSGNISTNLNLFQCCSKLSNVQNKWQEPDYSCDNNKKTYDQLYINCGGNATSVDGRDYEADLQPFGGSTFFLSKNKTWAYSSMGHFPDAVHDNYVLNSECNIPNSDTSLNLNARIAPISLKYYGFCLKNDNYTVRLHFAEIGIDTKRVSRIRKRVFNVEVQGGQYYLGDFDIEKEAAKKGDKVITLPFNVSVHDSRLEIHLYWSGKGSTMAPTKYYGPLISAITVFPVPKEVPRGHNKIPPFGIAGIVGSGLVFGILILALSWALGWIGHRKLKEGVEIYPGGFFGYHKLKAATNSFDAENKIGGVGNFYRGELDGIQIAVKQLSAKSKEGAQEFITAIGTISALKHPNLATLMGSCTEENELLLIYKYMENVSLQHALFGSEEVKSKLNWETRFRICLGVAKGLACLHESKLKVIHCNIKPTNILLDKDFTVKISDFGYSQFHDPQPMDAQLNKDKATLGGKPKPKITGYMAPEQIQGLPLTPKADVFSFGIITLEIVSGQEICTSRSKDSDYLLNKAYIYKEKGKLINLVDPSLENYNYKQAHNMLCLAMDCVNPSFDLRPTMSDVVKTLEGSEKFDSSSTSTPIVTSEPKATMSDVKTLEGSEKFDSSSTSTPIVSSEPKATFSRSTHSGSTSHEETSNTTISSSASKEIDDSINI